MGRRRLARADYSEAEGLQSLACKSGGEAKM